MKKKGQYSYSYHVNKLCENLKEEPSSYNTKSFHGSSDFVVLAWRQFGITIMQKRCMLYLFLVFWAKGRVATNSLTTLPSLNKKIYSFITFQKLSSASNFTIFCTSSKELSKFYKDVKCWRSKVLRNHQKVSIKSKQEKISNNKTISLLGKNIF